MVRIVEARQGVKDVDACGVTARVVRHGRTFGFRCGAKALLHGGGSSTTGSTRAAPDARRGEKMLELPTRERTAFVKIGELSRRRVPAHRHQQGLGGQLRGHRRQYRPADHAPGERIQHGRDTALYLALPEIRAPATSIWLWWAAVRSRSSGSSRDGSPLSRLRGPAQMAFRRTRCATTRSPTVLPSTCMASSTR